MLKGHLLGAGAAVVGLAVLLATWPGTRPSAQQAPLVTVPIDNDDTSAASSRARMDLKPASG